MAVVLPQTTAQIVMETLAVLPVQRMELPKTLVSPKAFAMATPAVLPGRRMELLKIQVIQVEAAAAKQAGTHLVTREAAVAADCQSLAHPLASALLCWNCPWAACHCRSTILARAKNFYLRAA